MSPARLRILSGCCSRGLKWQIINGSGTDAPAAMQARAPLILIHGFACGANDWGALPRMLAANGKRDVAVFSHRGIDGSTCPGSNDAVGSEQADQPCTVGDLAGDALSVLESVGWSDIPCHVMGISLGGMVAQQLAIDSPAQIRALVLGCTSHGGRNAAPPPADFLNLCESWALSEPDLETSSNASAFAEPFVDFMLPSDFTRRPGGRRLRAKVIAEFTKTHRSKQGLKSQLQALSRFNSTKNLPKIKDTPCLVLHGSGDAVVPFSNGQSLAEKIPGAVLQDWTTAIAHGGGGAGHFFWLDRPQELCQVLSGFLLANDAP